MLWRRRACQLDIETSGQARIKALGRAVTPYDDNHWNGVRQILVHEAPYAKFSQNPELGKLLKATGDALIAECNPRDRIRGIGLSLTDRERLDPSEWRGQNLLGYTPKMVRDKT